MKIAHVGIGQSYPSHVWMRRMRSMLGDRMVVNVDDLRNTPREATLDANTRYLPRKVGRWGRLARSLGCLRRSDSQLRSEWLHQTIVQSKANLVFVHFLDFAVQFDEVWNRLDIPVVVHCHGYDIVWDVRHASKLTPLHEPEYPQAVRSLGENVSFIANSTFTQKQLESIGIASHRIALKRFGVPMLDAPQPVSEKPDANLLFLGRLVDFKGPLETVRAFAKIAGRHPNVRLQIAGGGLLESEMLELVDRLRLKDRVDCLGAVDQDRGTTLRREASVFTAHNQTGLMTGQVEAFGVALLESMGHGVPVVTGRSGGIPDFIESGRNGWLFPPGDIDQHAAMLDELLSDPIRRAAFGRAAWETVRDRYQVEHERDDLNQIFDRAISGHVIGGHAIGATTEGTLEPQTVSRAA